MRWWMDGWYLEGGELQGGEMDDVVGDNFFFLSLSRIMDMLRITTVIGGRVIQTILYYYYYYTIGNIILYYTLEHQ